MCVCDEQWAMQMIKLQRKSHQIGRKQFEKRKLIDVRIYIKFFVLGKFKFER